MYVHSDTIRITVEGVVREHFATASDLCLQLREGAFRLDGGDCFENLCHRLEANIDAIRIAGNVVACVIRAGLEEDGGVVSVLSLLLAESNVGQPGASKQAVALLHDESPDVRQAASFGLRLASSSHVGPHLQALIGRLRWNFVSAAALDVLAFHRLLGQCDLGLPIDEEEDEVSWLLAEAGGRMSSVWNATHLEQFVGHASSRVREAALRASARSGLRELRAFCREATERGGAAEAVEFLGVVGSIDDLARLRRVVANPGLAKAVVGGLGRLGLPAGVPVLLDCLNSPDLVEPAAAAIQRITGLEVPRGALPEPPPELTEDELDFWEPVAPVDVSATREWWQANASRFDPEKRWQFGLCVSDDPLGAVFDQLPLCVRYDVYLRERALTPGTPDWELETWSWKQKNPSA